GPGTIGPAAGAAREPAADGRAGGPVRAVAPGGHLGHHRVRLTGPRRSGRGPAPRRPAPRRRVGPLVSRAARPPHPGTGLAPSPGTPLPSPGRETMLPPTQDRVTRNTAE